MLAGPRISKLRKTMKTDAFIALVSHNISYLTAADGISDEENPHILLVTATEAVLFTDSRYAEIAEKETAEEGLINVVCTNSRVEEELAHYLSKRDDLSTLNLEDGISYARFIKLNKLIEEQGKSLEPSSGIVEGIRLVKDAQEIERIAQAQSITDKSFSDLLGLVKAGMTEAELSAKLTYLLLKNGATALAFPNIVAGGPNGSLPHAVPGSRKVQEGDFITFDFGAEYKGYKSDMTRTIAIGAVSDEQRHIYETVLAAQEASLSIARAGLTGIQVDKAARDIIEKAGYGEFFGHGTGHGVGLDIHEAPSASPRSEKTLPCGSTLTVEPGIYIPNKYGVRIEDLVVLNEDGSQNLTKSPKQLIEL